MSNPAERRPPVKMTVRALVMDPVSNMPVVILQNADESQFLPIWIGVCEANAISLVLEGVPTPRPMTHDLIRDLLGATGFAVDHVFIHSLADSVFLASIHLVNAAGDSREVDARPSDALALALRTRSDVVVDPEVLIQAAGAEQSQDEAIRSILERLRPEDLGEYEM
ncbi:MAG TPA: bifunctional nuclease family protein [Thermoanaerobaculales bacterium]|nr:bifunctional nuclease family protein [Thermoanaerobaculales bacterium]HQN97047.1 bifunctional nuclease family protein [Thermoanaerobaculales bacterium]